MGIDNNTKLIFGMIIHKEQMNKIKEKYGDGIFYRESEYEGPLFIGRVSNYYDAGEEGMTYFVSITEPEITEYDINVLKEILNGSFDEYRLFLENLGIEYNEPKLISLVHVW